MKVNKDIVKNVARITNKIIIPKLKDLPRRGNLGEIIYNSDTDKYYGWTTNGWTLLNGGSFERVIVPGDTIINPNVETSLIDGVAPLGNVNWGAKVSGIYTESNYAFGNMADLNNSNNSFLAANYFSDLLYIYNYDGTVAFTLPYIGNYINANSAFITYSPLGIATLKGYAEPFFQSRDVSLNNNNYTAVAGYYDNLLSIYDGTKSLVSTLSSIGVVTAALIVYNPDNTLKWATKMGTIEQYQAGDGCAINDSQDVVISGVCSPEPLNIYNADGSFTIFNTGGPNNIFIVKYDDIGTCKWRTRINSTSNDIYCEIDMNNSGTIVIGGVNNTGNPGADMIPYNSNDTVAPTLSGNGFANLSGIFNYTFTLSHNWSSAIRNSTNFLKSIGINSSGEIVAAGLYGTDTLNIYNYDDSLSLTLPASGSGLQDYFLVKYNPSGTVMWGIHIPNGISSSTDTSVSAYINDLGEIVISGYYDVNPLLIYDKNGNIVAELPSTGNGDIFLIKYTEDGLLSWATTIAGTGTETGPAVVINDIGKIIVTGAYSSAVVNAYNSDGTIGATLTNDGAYDLFVVKYDSIGNSETLTMANPSTDGQLKIIASDGPTAYVNTSASIDEISTSIKFNKFDSIFMLWDANNTNWIRIKNNATLL